MTSNMSNESNTFVLAVTHKVPWSVAFSLEFLSSVIGNSIIVWIVYKDNQLKTTTNYLIANMAASDLLCAAFIFPRGILSINFDKQWLLSGDLGSAMCNLYVFTVEVCFAVSNYCYLFIAIDRYYAVAHPLKRPFRSKMKYTNAGIWLLACLLNSPLLFIYSYGQNCDSYSSIHAFYQDTMYIPLIMTVGLPAFLVFIAYTFIIYRLCKRKIPGESTDLARKRRAQQNKKVLKMSITIVALFYLLMVYWFTFINLIHHVLKRTEWLMLFSRFILNISLVHNFYIYLIFNDIYRRNIISVVSKYCICFNRAGEADLNRAEVVAGVPAVLEMIAVRHIGLVISNSNSKRD